MHLGQQRPEQREHRVPVTPAAGAGHTCAVPVALQLQPPALPPGLSSASRPPPGQNSAVASGWVGGPSTWTQVETVVEPGADGGHSACLPRSLGTLLPPVVTHQAPAGPRDPRSPHREPDSGKSSRGAGPLSPARRAAPTLHTQEGNEPHPSWPPGARLSPCPCLHAHRHHPPHPRANTPPGPRQAPREDRLLPPGVSHITEAAHRRSNGRTRLGRSRTVGSIALVSSSVFFPVFLLL